MIEVDVDIAVAFAVAKEATELLLSRILREREGNTGLRRSVPVFFSPFTVSFSLSPFHIHDFEVTVAALNLGLLNSGLDM